MASDTEHNVLLVVDDDEDMLEAVSSVFKKAIPDAKVLTAMAGDQAFAIAQQELPDVIMLDVVMPGIDGFKLSKLLKVHEDTQHIPLIMITALKSDPSSKVKGLESGADVFLSKPIDRAELVAQVNAMLRIKKAEDRLRKEKQDLHVQVGQTARQLKDEKEKSKKSEVIIRQYADIIENMQVGLLLFHLEDLDDDHSLRLVSLNPATETILGMKEEQLVGKTLDQCFPLLRDQNLPQAYAEVVRTGKPLQFDEIFYGDENIKDGYFSVRAVPLPDNHVAVMFENITKRKTYEKQIKKSLDEKEVLLREVHHRVKNNLSMIASLLNIQARSLKDKEAQEACRQSRKRIHTIALLHEKLYRSQDFTNIQLREYINELLSTLGDLSHFPKEECEFDIDIPDVNFTIDTIIPLALIITELVTNSLKYGSRTGKKLTIHIHLERANERYVLTVADDGPGIGHEMDWRNLETLGLQLVITLTEQLRGRLELEDIEGASFRITFPKPNHVLHEPQHPRQTKDY